MPGVTWIDRKIEDFTSETPETPASETGMLLLTVVQSSFTVFFSLFFLPSRGIGEGTFPWRNRIRRMEKTQLACTWEDFMHLFNTLGTDISFIPHNFWCEENNKKRFKFGNLSYLSYLINLSIYFLKPIRALSTLAYSSPWNRLDSNKRNLLSYNLIMNNTPKIHHLSTNCIEKYKLDKEVITFWQELHG